MAGDTIQCDGVYRFRLLGALRAHSSAGACNLRISGKTLEVLAFLMTSANRPVRRTMLSNAVWGDQSEHRSRANLNTALWRINRALKTLGCGDVRLHVTASQLTLIAGASVFIDVLRLEDSIREAAGSSAALSAAARDALIDALSGDCEPFLDGLSSEWILVERERVFNLQIRGMILLMQDLAQSGRIEEALDYGRRILHLDPMRECVQRQVMWLYMLSGHQGNAVRQYRECARILEEELGVAPMAETRALYEFIVSPNRPPAGPARHAGGSAPNYSIHRDAMDGAAFDDELNRLRGLLTRLNSHRRSVFSALSEDRTG